MDAQGQDEEESDFQLAELMRFDAVKKEVEGERNLERWAKRSTSCFTKKVKRMLYAEIDNVVWNNDEEEITKLCKQNKDYDEITESEIEEIWKRKPRQR